MLEALETEITQLKIKQKAQELKKVKSKNDDNVACLESNDEKAHVLDKEMRLINAFGKQCISLY